MAVVQNSSVGITLAPFTLGTYIVRTTRYSGNMQLYCDNKTVSKLWNIFNETTQNF